MERSRTPRPSEGSSVDTVHPLPGAASLPVLLGAVSSPGVLQEEVDALIQGLARPLAENEAPRERADFLLHVLEDRDSAALKGSDGRTVLVAAVEALLELGYPYALEVPPEALAEAQRSREDSAPQDIPRAGIIAASIAMLAQSLPFIPGLIDSLSGDRQPGLVFVLFIIGSIWGPSLSALLGGWRRSLGLQRLGLITMALIGSVWLSVFALSASTDFHQRFLAIISLVSGLSLVGGAILLRSPGWRPRQGRTK